MASQKYLYYGNKLNRPRNKIFPFPKPTADLKHNTLSQVFIAKPQSFTNQNLFQFSPEFLASEMTHFGVSL